MAEAVTKQITAGDTFSDAALVKGDFNVSIQGTFSATVTVQRSYDQDTISNWEDVETFTTAVERIGFEPESMYYRVGVKSGEFTSGTIDIRIGTAD